MLSGNKGEWSEIYVLFKLLSEGKLFAADSELNRLDDIYFPVIKVIREEISGELKEYYTGEHIDIYVNGEKLKSVDKNKFD
ncbi:MAG: HpaII family restriction endonuclease, partial [Ezakiella sp.]|nr:HpaII family restriction endonuclease [Ezakiella sp.]